MNPNQNNGNKGGGPQPPKKRGIAGAILWAVAIVIFFNFLAAKISNAGTQEVPYSAFIQMIEEAKVATVELSRANYIF